MCENGIMGNKLISKTMALIGCDQRLNFISALEVFSRLLGTRILRIKCTTCTLGSGGGIELGWGRNGGMRQKEGGKEAFQGRVGSRGWGTAGERDGDMTSGRR